MKVREISKSRDKKVSYNYNSVGYSIGITIEPTTEEESLEELNAFANELLNKLSLGEELRLGAFIEGMKIIETEDFKKAAWPSEYNKALPVVGTTEKTLSKHGEITPKDNTEVKEEVLMDLEEVTVMAQTDKSLLVVKKGYQKWVAFSLIINGNPGVENGTFMDGIDLKDKAEKWFHDKTWEKFKVVKK